MDMKKNQQQSPFEKQVALAAKQTARVHDMMQEVEYYTARRETDRAYERAFDAAHAVETLCLNIRELPAYTGNPNARHRHAEAMLATSPVQVTFTAQGWLCLIIPALLPKKGKGGTQYIHDMLYTAVSAFTLGKPPFRFTRCSLEVRHVYNKARPEREYRDHDNIELNIVVDIVARYFMDDDAALLCQRHSYGCPGDGDRTEVFVVPQADHMRFYQDVVLGHGKGVVLHGKRQ